MSDQPTEMTPEEIEEFCQEWQSHLDTLEGKVDEDLLSLARVVIQPDNFGREQGQLWPNRSVARFSLLGLWIPVPAFADDDMLAVCRITAEETEEASRDPMDDEDEQDAQDLLGFSYNALRLSLAVLNKVSK